jgi:hypothetical protein
MSYTPLMFYFGLFVLGLLVLMFSRTLNTSEKDQFKDQRPFSEMLYGPPGYYRASFTLFGVVLVIVGLAGVLAVLFLPL